MASNQALKNFVAQSFEKGMPSRSSAFSKQILEDMREHQQTGRTLDEHISVLTSLSGASHHMTETEAAHLLSAFRVNPGLVSVTKLMFGEAGYRLTLIGLPPILEMIATGKMLHEIAETLKVPVFLLYKFLTNTSDHRDAFREALAVGADIYAQRADVAAVEHDEALARHWRWRAEKADPDRYGKPPPDALSQGHGNVFELHVDLSSHAQSEVGQQQKSVLEATAVTQSDTASLLEQFEGGDQ